MVAGGDVANTGADFGDDAGGLVSECHGHRAYAVAVDD
jgi:hypothetical protein